VPPRRRNPALDADLEAIILRALEKDKGHRYQSAAGLAREIERYLDGEAVDARSGSGWYMLRKAVAVNRVRLYWAALAGVLLLAAGVAVVLSIAQARDSARVAAFQQAQARSEGVRARAVTELLREVLPGADPAHPEHTYVIAGGLSRLYNRLETGAYAADPDLDQSLRRMWGGIYTDIGPGKAAGYVEYAEVALRTGLVRLRMEHEGDHLDIASTLHALAGVLYVRQRSPEAETICRDALAMRARILGEATLPVAESRALLARILFALKRESDAEREADTVLALQSKLPGGRVTLLMAMMTAIKARVALDAGQYERCEPLLLDSLRQRLALLSPDDPDEIASLTDAARFAQACPDSKLANTLRTAWGSTIESFPADIARDLPILAVADHGAYANFRRTGRTDALARLIGLYELIIGPDDPGLVTPLFARVRSAEVEERSEARAESALRAADLLSKKFGPNDFSVLLCLDQAALAFAFSNRHDKAAELARRACGIWESIPETKRDRLFAANARRRLGWFLAVGGRYDEARDSLSRAESELKAVVGAEHHVVALTEAMLAFCDLEQGRIAEADSLSAHAQDIADRSIAIAPDQKAHIEFVRGRLLHTMKKDAQARPLLEGAWAAYYHFHRPDYPWRIMLVTDLAETCEALGDRAAAEQWRAALYAPPTEQTGK
ncbi:MAG: tetratricopeptide repeat protein, partial [Phycisphaerae bacterium]|nr:tetratricopeptide repeat protein [Phycisphaerae bacterium]